ncbi:1-aminocyclopropane-1-carboxylate oxidase homolog 1-like [Cornus florida]|uniref:1-aminocyclopropane-1-carboxylate oxidase homolog 1-like n=1 Tax=Cornus florida TaxID=4283 RepID=UPI002897B731|nr:1-aminocyclopropane-1-carboxylate oxidase homolog 1-like [Cornus florida]
MEAISSNGHYDWAKEVKDFDETKAGVKGLVDAGVTKIPKFFVHPKESLESLPPAKNPSNDALVFPTIDLQGMDSYSDRRREIVDGIRTAASEWGFFRLVNHGVPMTTLDAMLDAVRRFHEQPREDKMELYSADSRRRVRFNSNVAQRELDAACWRDLLTCVFHDDTLDPEAIPLVCRKEVQEYVKCMIQLRETMCELLSEALGLNSDHLSRLECMKSEALACLYYPICPQPELTLGTVKHSDTTFLTLLLQDTTGGLQIVHQNQWFDVPPVPGALIANIGDLMQIISNDKFKSVEHRVLAQPIGPRVSVACFFTPSGRAGSKTFGPIKELVTEESPAIYREFLCGEYYQYYKMKGTNVTSALPHYKL